MALEATLNKLNFIWEEIKTLEVQVDNGNAVYCEQPSDKSGKLISAITKPHHTMRGAVWGGLWKLLHNFFKLTSFVMKF